MQKKKWKTPVAVAAGVAMFIGTGTAFAVTVPAHHAEDNHLGLATTSTLLVNISTLGSVTIDSVTNPLTNAPYAASAYSGVDAPNATVTVTFHFNKDATVSDGEQIVVPFKGTGDLNAALEGLPSELKNAAGQTLFTVSKNSAGDIVLTATGTAASLNNLQAEMTATVAFTNPHPVSSTSGTSQSQSFGFQIGNASSGVYTLTPLTTGNQSNTGVVDDNMQMCDNGLETSFGDGVNWSALQNAVIASKSSTVDVNGITPDTDFYVITTLTSPHATTFTVGNIEDLDTLYPVGNLPQFTNNARYIDSMATNTHGSFTKYLLCRRTEMHELLISCLLLIQSVSWHYFRRIIGLFLFLYSFRTREDLLFYWRSRLMSPTFLAPSVSFLRSWCVRVDRRCPLSWLVIIELSM